MQQPGKGVAIGEGDPAHNVTEQYFRVHPDAGFGGSEIIAGMQAEPIAGWIELIDAIDHESAGIVAIAIVHQAVSAVAQLEGEGMISIGEA